MSPLYISFSPLAVLLAGSQAVHLLHIYRRAHTHMLIFYEKKMGEYAEMRKGKGNEASSYGGEHRVVAFAICVQQ